MGKKILVVLSILVLFLVGVVSVVSAEAVRYEADKAVINNAQVYTGFPDATEGLCVGYVDFEDSYVEFTVPVDVAGTYQILMRVSTGDTGASHFLTVNGVQVDEIVYTKEGAGWGVFADYIREITLQAGNNTIRMSKGVMYAAPDYIELTLVEAEATAAPTEEPNPQTGDPALPSILLAAAASVSALATYIRKGR